MLRPGRRPPAFGLPVRAKCVHARRTSGRAARRFPRRCPSIGASPGLAAEHERQIDRVARAEGRVGWTPVERVEVDPASPARACASARRRAGGEHALADTLGQPCERGSEQRTRRSARCAGWCRRRRASRRACCRSADRSRCGPPPASVRHAGSGKGATPAVGPNTGDVLKPPGPASSVCTASCADSSGRSRRCADRLPGNRWNVRATRAAGLRHEAEAEVRALAIARLNSPRVSGADINATSECAPADSPNRVTWPGSPPNAAMFSLTQRSAAI